MMKVGIISFAHMHAQSYAECFKILEEQGGNVNLVAIADADEERGRNAATRFDCTYFRDYQDLLATDVDAVVVCSENVLHAEMVIAAAEARKHVLCEKPLATTVGDARRMIAASERAGIILQVAFPVRFNSAIQRLQKMVVSEELGRIIAIRGTNRGKNPDGWFVDQSLSGGGAVLDHTVHVVDLMRWMLRSEVKEVFAEVDTRFHSIDVDDCGLLLLEFENGVFASHDPSWSRPKMYPTWGDVTLEVVGTNGVSVVDAFAQHLTDFGDTALPIQHAFWGNSMDLGLIRDFVDCVTSGRSPFITGMDGLQAVAVALAAYESARTGKPIPLAQMG